MGKTTRREYLVTIPDKYWVIFFRRAMMQIANIIADKIDAVTLVTGDSVGQVASQTLSNIRAIQEISELPIIRPLAGSNKEDIINRAKAIGTYNISIEPYEDCCSFFVPPHPETKAKLNQVQSLQNSLEINEVYKETMNKIEKIKFEYLGD